MNQIKVLLADDQQLFVDGMQAVLANEKDIKVVGCAYDGEAVLEFLEKNQADIVVLDIEMPKLDGIEVAKVIRKKYPKLKILVLSMYNRKHFILNLMNLGVSGYILKNRSKEELVNAIHTVQTGKAYYGLDVLEELSKNKTVLNQEEVKLSKRQKEILVKIAEGYTVKQISDKLFISEPTVNTHKRNLLKKLNVPNEKFLVRYAIREGYIQA